MFKQEAICVLGGSVASAAQALGITYQAVSQWPDTLPSRIADRVQAALWRMHHGNAPLPAPTEQGPAMHEQSTAIERATCGQVTRADLRPHDWQQIWPEREPGSAKPVPQATEVTPKPQPAQSGPRGRGRRAVDRAAARADVARAAINHPQKEIA